MKIAAFSERCAHERIKVVDFRAGYRSSPDDLDHSENCWDNGESTHIGVV